MDSKERIAKALEVSTDTRAFELGRGNLFKAPEMFKEFFEGRDALVVADVNTYRVAGEEVFRVLSAAGIPTLKYIFKEKEFHADWDHIEELDKVLTETGAIAVSVGSGTINDLCKLCSHHHGQGYMTVPTAASVDGYTSFGASITKDNSKQTFDCPAPVAVLADIDIIAAAPKDMTAAGYADLAAKVPAGGEWMIADAVGAEPIIPEAWHVLQDDLDTLLSNPEGVAAGDPAARAPNARDAGAGGLAGGRRVHGIACGRPDGRAGFLPRHPFFAIPSSRIPAFPQSRRPRLRAAGIKAAPTRSLSPFPKM